VTYTGRTLRTLQLQGIESSPVALDTEQSDDSWHHDDMRLGGGAPAEFLDVDSHLLFEHIENLELLNMNTFHARAARSG